MKFDGARIMDWLEKASGIISRLDVVRREVIYPRNSWKGGGCSEDVVARISLSSVTIKKIFFAELSLMKRRKILFSDFSKKNLPCTVTFIGERRKLRSFKNRVHRARNNRALILINAHRAPPVYPYSFCYSTFQSIFLVYPSSLLLHQLSVLRPLSLFFSKGERLPFSFLPIVGGGVESMFHFTVIFMP